MKNILIFSAKFFLVAFAMTGIIFGQETTGRLEGQVRDPNGGLVPNVTITVNSSSSAAGSTTTGTGSGFRRTITTDSEGFFRVLQIPPGVYTVQSAATSGFGESKYENVTVALGQTTQLNIVVNPGTALNTVDVLVTDAPPVYTTNSAIHPHQRREDRTITHGNRF